MADPTRKILEIEPRRSWLILSAGRWAYDAPPNHSAVPIERTSIGLLPLVERPRQDVESEARSRLQPGDPDRCD